MSIALNAITKTYNHIPVVDAVSLDIADGECFVLLGPSGSGKSTLLRMIAGLADVDGGQIRLHGVDATSLLPQAREIGFVFQHYALFQHMTVGANIEFGLRVRRMPKRQRHQRRDELLELVDLVGLADRLPRQLSGGQQQRVALARALAPKPSILLLDEPFGALDAQIRADLRANLRRIQRDLGITTIFVTHDQEEAFELADRIGVMRAGQLLEVGAPRDLYLRPQTPFTATFLGTANLWQGELRPTTVRVGSLTIPLATAPDPAFIGRQVQILIRPEDIAVAPSAAEVWGTTLGMGTVQRITFTGTLERLRVQLASIPGIQASTLQASNGADGITLDVARTQQQSHAFPLREGDAVWVGVQRAHPLLDRTPDLCVARADEPPMPMEHHLAATVSS